MKRLLRVFLIGAAVLLALTVALNLLCILPAAPRIREAQQVEPADCIVVLGTGLFADGTPGNMLTLRLNVAIDLYRQGAAPKMLMTGDHGSPDYDEVNAMKRYAVEHGVPAEDIFMDHAGFCTYDSMAHTAQMFGGKSVIIVSQGYHLYRAIHDAGTWGLQAQGVAAPCYDYGWRYLHRLYLRECLARPKDLVTCLLKLPPSTDAARADLSGSGAVTDDAATALWMELLTN